MISVARTAAPSPHADFKKLFGAAQRSHRLQHLRLVAGPCRPSDTHRAAFIGSYAIVGDPERFGSLRGDVETAAGSGLMCARSRDADYATVNTALPA